MALFSMNDDVVLLVLAELAPQDARQLIMTSHAGYELFFLRQVDLTGQSGPTQTNAERMRKFCEFMLADPDRRIPYLRVLRLNGSTFAGPGTQVQMGQNVLELSYSCPCHLSRVLRSATGLRELQLWRGRAPQSLQLLL